MCWPPAGSQTAGADVRCFLGSAGTGLFFLLLAVVDGYVALLGTMTSGGLAFSLFDLSYPSLGGDYERQHREEAMTLLYSGFGGAVALGAFGSGLALRLGGGYEAVYAALGALLLIVAATVVRVAGWSEDMRYSESAW